MRFQRSFSFLHITDYYMSYNTQNTLPLHDYRPERGYAPGTRFFRRTYRLVAQSPKGQRQARKRMKILNGHQKF